MRRRRRFERRSIINYDFKLDEIAKCGVMAA
jgi:hypothetical protein